MKPLLLSAAAAVLAATAAPAFAQNADVEIENAVARVVVIVENRADVKVEIEQGRSNLPALRLVQDGDKVRLDGGLGRRMRGLGNSMSVDNCRSGPENATQPGQGASVEVRDHGRINLEDAPLIVIRSPRAVNVSAGGAVFGSIGRGASSVELNNGGCGDWTVANTDGRVEVSSGGSGTIRVGTSRDLEAALGGSGTLIAGATGGLDLALGGSGRANIASVDGDAEIAIGGSGEVTIRRGRIPNLEIAIGGSGDVDFGGTAGDVEVSIAGSGDIRVAEATGRVSRSIIGSGDVRIGR